MLFSSREDNVFVLLDEVKSLLSRPDFQVTSSDANAESALQSEVFRKLAVCQRVAASLSPLTHPWTKYKLMKRLKKINAQILGMAQGNLGEPHISNEQLPVFYEKLNVGIPLSIKIPANTFTRSPNPSFTPEQSQEEDTAGWIVPVVGSPREKDLTTNYDPALTKPPDLWQARRKLLASCKWSGTPRGYEFRLDYLEKEYLDTAPEQELMDRLVWDVYHVWNFSEFPIGVSLSIVFPEKDPRVHMEPLRKLCQAGVRIWSCRVTFTYSSSRVHRKPLAQAEGLYRALCVFCEYLALLPEIRRLELHESDWPKKCSRGVGNQLTAAHVQHLPLPRLPKLRFLNIQGLVEMPTCLKRKLLEKYGSQLKSLRPPPEKERSGRWWETLLHQVESPKLTALQMVYRLRKTSSEWPLAFRQFPHCPLKYLDLSIDRKHYTHSFYHAHFPTLLKTISWNFGGTLEKLCVQVKSHSVALKGGEARNSEWISSLHFPKLKEFECQGCPGGWSFLLQFPALVSLLFSNFTCCALNHEYFPMDEILQLSWNVREMLRSNVWKLFPDLEVVQLEWRRDFLRVGAADLEREQVCHRITRQAVREAQRLQSLNNADGWSVMLESNVLPKLDSLLSS